MAAASTGKESSRRTTVIKIAQANKGIRSINMPLWRILNVVDIKFTAPKIEEIPAK